MRLINQFLNILGMFGVIVWTIIWSLLMIFFSWMHPSVGFFVLRNWSRGCCWLMGVKSQVTGASNLPKEKAAVLAANHSSIFDIIVLSSLPVNAKWISKMEVAKVPFLGLAMRAMNTYFVKRDSSGADLNVMKEVEDGLRGGVSVFIFPEGTRTRTGDLLPFKKGAFRTAQNAGVPIIPIGVLGTYDIAPPGTVPSRRGHRVEVRIGAPMDVPRTGELTQVMERFRETLVGLLANEKAPKMP